MSIEERLRLGLQREGSVVQPSTEAALADVLRRSRWRHLARRAAWAAAAACIGAVALTLAPGWLAPEQQGVPMATPSVTASIPAESVLIGTYEIDLPDAAAASVQGMSGRWRVELDREGRLTIGQPPGYEHPTSGAGYTTAEGELTTNALVGHPGCQTGATGRYRWSADGTTLRFQMVADTCVARTVLFTEQQWRRVP